jgi:hypothetical protein
MPKGDSDNRHLSSITTRFFSHLATICRRIVILAWDHSPRGGNGDMNDDNQFKVGMIRFTLREETEPDLLEQAAAEIRELPTVLRVRTNPTRQEIEIVFKQPAEGLLRQINTVLKSVGTAMTASNAR